MRVTGMRPEVVALLQRHSWPGNVRELKAIMDRSLLFARSSELVPADLALDLRGSEDASLERSADAAASGSAPLRSLGDMEREHIQFVLEFHQGNISAAARTLGINRVTLYKRLATYGSVAAEET